MKTTVLLFAAALSCLALAACGGSEEPAAAEGDDRDAARVKLAQCLRENGVDVPDPGSGPTRIRVDRADRTKLQAAMKACEKYREQAMPDLSEEDRQEMQDAFVKFRQCMKQRGVPVPNIAIGGPGSAPPAEPPAGAQRIDPDDPEFQAAEKACSKLLPQRRMGGPAAE